MRNPILISHRGNLIGPSPHENSPQHIDFAISVGFDVEVDVRVTPDGIYLGHDFPQYKVSKEYLLERANRLWCHAKSYEALVILMQMGMHCFFHENDPYTITSRGYIWAYPGWLADGGRTISVCGESVPRECAGCCSDYVDSIRKSLNVPLQPQN